jgi:hypothetical protein
MMHSRWLACDGCCPSIAGRAQASAPEILPCQRPAGQNFSRSCGKRKSTEKFCKGGAMSALTAGREPLSRAKPLNLDVTAEGLPLEQPPVLP